MDDREKKERETGTQFFEAGRAIDESGSVC